MIRLSFTGFVLAVTSFSLTRAIPLDVNDTSSIINASATLALGVQSYYHNNVSGTDPTAVGVFPGPYSWWEAGAVWGSMIDNWAYSKDTSYVSVIQQALLAQVGPDNNYEPPAYRSSLGNDDQAFWCFAVLSALEYNFPVPSANASSTWYDLAVAVWNTQESRWNTTQCNGGLHWQIYPENGGYDYKNSIANGGFLQISARLARYTGNQTYADWAEKVWNWMTGIGLIDDQYTVYDGSDDTINCTQIDHDIWSYSPAALLYGAANMYSYTNGSSVWGDRVNGLLSNMERTFFSVYSNATNIMSEINCEPQNNCDTDQPSFKAYVSRWMSKSAVLMPSIQSSVQPLLSASAIAAAQSCSGGNNSETCGLRWYVGGYDGNYGLGQELSAMSTVQSLLLLNDPIVPISQVM